MALPPIQIQLSKFEQIEILRTEIELREQELKQTEKQIREVLVETERLKYLRTVHPIFTQLPVPEASAHLPQFQANREALAGALDAMRAALTALEAETAGQTAPAARNLGGGLPRPGAGAGLPRPGLPAAPGAPGVPAAPRPARFDTFDQFRANKQQ